MKLHHQLAIGAFLAICCLPLRATTVCNVGFPGENSAQLLARLPAALASCHGVRTVVLFVGMNDAVNDQRFLAPGETAINLTAMLQQLATRRIGAVVVTLHLPDVSRLMQRHPASVYGELSPEQRIDATNRALLQAAKNGGAQIADFHTALAQAGGPTPALSTDGVHLTSAGYRLLAETVLHALPRGARQRPILCFGDSLTYGVGVRAAASEPDNAHTYPAQLQQLLDHPL